MEINEQLQTFNGNLKYLMKKNNITQKKLSDLTKISPATINNYVSKGSEPSVEFLIALKKYFNLDMDSLFFSDISKDIEIKPKDEKLNYADRYLGSYIMYYYNSSEYKGKLSSYSKSTLKYGVLSLVMYKNNSKITAIANFLKSRDEAEELKQKLESLSIVQDIEKLHKNLEQVYFGKLEVSEQQLFIYLKSEENNDQSLIILNNPPSKHSYIGGLGTANSVSRGREHMPCIQFILVSRSILKIPDGEIYNMLSLGVSDVNVETESEQLITLFKNLFVNVDLKDDLSEFQKKKIIENSLTNTFIELIDANMFRFAKVSNMEDDDYYRIIRGEEI